MMEKASVDVKDFVEDGSLARIISLFTLVCKKKKKKIQQQNL